MNKKDPPKPVHVKGMKKGEEYTMENGKEPGRGGPGPYRTARDSTSISAEDRDPIHPDMPNIPPA